MSFFSDLNKIVSEVNGTVNDTKKMVKDTIKEITEPLPTGQSKPTNLQKIDEPTSDSSKSADK